MAGAASVPAKARTAARSRNSQAKSGKAVRMSSPSLGASRSVPVPEGGGRSRGGPPPSVRRVAAAREAAACSRVRRRRSAWVSV
eukprot:scaffold2022_cov96-Isochrysis_galbana.AAC.1